MMMSSITNVSLTSVKVRDVHKFWFFWIGYGSNSIYFNPFKTL